jgi:hypothetical protein
LASRRLPLGIVQAILALLLFAGIPALAGWHGGSMADTVIAANDETSGDPGNGLDGRLDLFTEMSLAISGDEPPGGPDDSGASRAETDGDSGEDGAASAWTAMGWPFDEGLRFRHARVAAKRGLSAAHGATGPPPGADLAERAV